MSYELHISRRGLSGEDVPIDRGDWADAMDKVGNARFLPVEDLDGDETDTVEIFVKDARLPSGGSWQSAMYLGVDNHASFNSRSIDSTDDGTFDPSCVMWQITAALARELGAGIYGDEGETYDLETAEGAE